MSTDKVIELAKKIKVLAEKGEGGEKRNAEAMLADLMRKYGISAEQVESPVVKRYYFQAKGINHDILTQCVVSTNYELRDKFWTVKTMYRKTHGDCLCECTAAEYIEISQKYDLYKKLYKKELDVFFRAFCTANDLLGTPPKMQTTDDLTDKERDEFIRAARMANSIKKERVTKQITN